MKTLILVTWGFVSHYSLAQGGLPIVHNASLNTPDEMILFRGLENYVVVKPKVGDTNTYVLRSDECAILKRTMQGMDLPPGSFCVRPEKIGFAHIYLCDVDNLVEPLQTLEYKVSNLPVPEIFIDDVLSGGEINKIPATIAVKYRSEIPLRNEFVLMNWEFSMDGKFYKGSGEKLTKEFMDQWSKMNKGTSIAVVVTYRSPDGISRKMAGVFQIN